MVLVHPAVSMKKNSNKSIFISLYKAQVQVDHRPPQKQTNKQTNKQTKNQKTGTLKQIEKKVGKSL
jgi:predicted Abi (CAAX) family protease